MKELLSSILLSTQEVDNTLIESTNLAETIETATNFQAQAFHSIKENLASLLSNEVRIYTVDAKPLPATLYLQLLRETI